MKSFVRSVLAIALAGGAAASSVLAQEGAPNCKAVHADLVESRSTTECRPGHTACFLGAVDGNHGLRGTTYFRGTSSTPPIPASPAFVGYSGDFEYITDRGTLFMHESGVTSSTEGVVTAHQKIVDANGEFTGVTGRFFVSGRTGGGQVVTTLTGEICYP